MSRIGWLFAAALLSACNPSTEKDPEYLKVTHLAGSASEENTSSSFAFSFPMPNLTAEERALHLQGDKDFELAFIVAQSVNHPDKDGLGPAFNQSNCEGCHNNDGRPATLIPKSADGKIQLGTTAGLFLRISLANAALDAECTALNAKPSASNNYCQAQPVPGYSDQLFHLGVYNLRNDDSSSGQADVYLSYAYQTVQYADGDSITLKKPLYYLDRPYDAPSENSDTPNPSSRLLQEDVRYSWRNGMPMIGLGLLELIPEADILALADPEDRNKDGISGRPNYVLNALTGEVSLGRFGWKASTPSVRQQSLGALRGDMGITNSLFADESIKNTALHEGYLSRVPEDNGQDSAGNPEATPEFENAVVFYAETLAVPVRRDVQNQDVRAGGRLFQNAGCTQCHHPAFTTATGSLLEIGGARAPAALQGQKIWPFTDMLLHDMGEGLADHRRDFLASGNEWKTRPLWGIGLTKRINNGAGFLHDGRAATLEEAILWHGGEAESAKEHFRTLPKAQRQQLIAFLNSL